jgi:hypothetical protein
MKKEMRSGTNKTAFENLVLLGKTYTRPYTKNPNPKGKRMKSRKKLPDELKL